MGTLEGRLMKMLDGVADLTLELLNEATQAWGEIEYNCAVHRETSCSPVDRFARAPDVFRTSPSSEALRDAFRLQTRRSQRQSDGTISLDGVRFEIPARYRHFRELSVRYARWDLGRVDLVDEPTGTILSPIYPLDKTANADGRRALKKSKGNSLDMSWTHGSAPTVNCRHFSRASSRSIRPRGCRRPICPRHLKKTTENSHEQQETAGGVRAEMEPVFTRASFRRTAGTPKIEHFACVWNSWFRKGGSP